jgi:hypothetical protein
VKRALPPTVWNLRGRVRLCPVRHAHKAIPQSAKRDVGVIRIRAPRRRGARLML